MSEQQPNPRIDAEEIFIDSKTLFQLKDKIVLVDVRQPEEFILDHIPEGVLIPLGELSQRAENELSKESDIVTYCAHGIRSLQAALILKNLGFKHCRSLKGGIVAWNEWKQFH